MYENEIVHALWWKQPFASLMLEGKIETRNRPTKVRGLVLICATKYRYLTVELERFMLVQQFCYGEFLIGDFKDLPRGEAIAIGELVDCRPMTLEDEAACFVCYKPGLFCWIFENVQPIEPFDIKGAQGWRILDQETKDKIEILK